MNKLWSDISQRSTNSHKRHFTTSLSFTNTVTPLKIQQEIQNLKTSGKDCSSNKFCRVLINEQFVVKTDIKPLKKRFKETQFNINTPHKGNVGILGEALNTLVAQDLDFPGHQLLGLSHTHMKYQTSLLFKKLDNKPIIETIKLAHTDSENILLKCFSFLDKSLEKKFFHGDTNLGNIFLNDDLTSGHFIDFELAMPFECDHYTALTLQIANMRNRLLDKIISRDEFYLLAKKYMQEQHPYFSNFEHLFDLFYKEKLSKDLRKKRISIIKGCELNS